MTKAFSLLAAAAAVLASPAYADAEIDLGSATGAGRSSSRELPPYLECVPYARQVSGIQIFGDAHTWWGQAEGRYARGHKPRVGAVMAFRPSGNMTLGHVAAVSKIVDKRTVLLRHANWSPIDGRRGQIENDVMAVDVSPNNDWSQVRVWYAPLQALGTTAWPVEGFIYNDRSDRPGTIASAPARVPVSAPAPASAPPRPRADVIGAIIARNS